MNAGKLKYSDYFKPEDIEYYSNNICDYVEDIIFHKEAKINGGKFYLSNQQKDICEAIQDNKKVTVKSGRGIGKTSAVGFITNWWLTMFPSAEQTKVICTAPSFPQLQTALWPEIHKWTDMSLHSELFEHNSAHMVLKEMSKKVWAEPRTARTKESFSGIHAPYLLIIVDEASGMDDEILDVLENTLTSGDYNRILYLSNPTKVIGGFYNTHMNPKISKNWKAFTCSAEDAPFVDKSKIKEQEEVYGRDHPLFQVNVLGNFPSGNEEAFISLADVQQAMTRHIHNPTGEIEIGLDVARMGDDKTVLFWRQGDKVYPPKIMNKSKGPEIEQLVYDTVDEIRSITGYNGVIKVKVDDIGVGGIVVDYLEQDREHKIEVIPVIVQSKVENEDYFNELSFMWGIVKNRINQMDLSYLNDRTIKNSRESERLVEELAARRWDGDTGKTRIESKKSFKKKFNYSPDFSDAFVMCFYNKKNPRCAIKNFDPLDSDIIVDKFNYLPEKKFCSVFYSRDLFISIIYSAWDGNKLSIYDEYIGDDPVIKIATDIRQRGPFYKIIGNYRMFSNGREDLESKFNKYRVSVRENYMYNEAASIETMNILTVQKRIMLSANCERTIKQLSQWRMDTTKIKQETDFGLCYAITNIISMLKREIEKPIQHNDFSVYSGERDREITNINHNKNTNKLAWMLN